jgi:hypothetical protein
MVYNFPDSFRTSDLRAHFASWGGAQIRWIDQTSCLALLQDAERVDEAVARYSRDPVDVHYTIVPINMYQRMQREQQEEEKEEDANRADLAARTQPEDVDEGEDAIVQVMPPLKSRKRKQ